MSGVAGVCSGLVAVFHAQRVCPVENPCVWPSWVPPRRCACVYDAIFVGRSTSRINMLSSPCLCTANSGLGEGPTGIYGRNTLGVGSGVIGYSDGGRGVWGHSNHTGSGVLGESAQGVGVM